MQIRNLIQMNDWDSGRFLKVVIAIQIAALAVIWWQIPVITPVVGVIGFSFIPGIVILRLLKLHDLGTIETLLYATGLSVGFLMFVGFFINTLYPYVGISRPISLLPVIITVSTIVVAMCVVSYYRDRGLYQPNKGGLSAREILSPPTLFLLLLPVLSILGASLMNSYGNNTILLVLITLVALTAVLIAFDRFIPRRLYPLAVIMIAISLLLHRSLISMYLVGWDIQVEYSVYQAVMANSYWISTAPVTPFNTMLSVTILPTMYSYLLGLEGTWLFKIVYPLLFSLVPLGVYLVSRKQTNDKVAFLSVFFFMSFAFFFGAMTEMARQQIALLFLVLLMLLMVDRQMHLSKRAGLAIIFSLMLVLSQYYLAYLYLIYVLFAWLLLMVLGNRLATVSSHKHLSPEINMITGNSVTLFLVMVLAWYIYNADAEVFSNIARAGREMYTGFITEFFVPGARDLGILRELGLAPLPVASLGREIANIINHITRLFIFIGVIRLVVKYKRMRFAPEYAAFTLISLGLLAMCVLLPYFTKTLSSARLYFVTLVFLSPLFVMGGETFFKGISMLFRLAPRVNESTYARLMLIVLIPYFLFSTGFIYQVTGDVPNSISLSNSIDSVRFDRQEVTAAKWLVSNREHDSKVYTDWFGHVAFSSYVDTWGYVNIIGGRGYQVPGQKDSEELTIEVPAEAYIYLRRINISQGKVLLAPQVRLAELAYYDLPGTHLLQGRSKIYSNGGAEVYK